MFEINEMRLEFQGIKKAGGGQQDLPHTARSEILELASRVVQENGGGGGEGALLPPRRPFSLKFQADAANDAVKTPQEALGMCNRIYSRFLHVLIL